MEATRDGPHNLCEPRFDVHVNIFKIEIFGNPTGVKFLGNLVEAMDDLCGVLGLDNPLIRQHRDMSEACADILLP